MSQVWSHTWLVFQPSSRNQPCLRARRVNSVPDQLGLSSSDSVKLKISAVTSAEPKILVQKHVFQDVTSSPNGHFDSASEDSDDELDEREKLRRMRISKANKGNTPWNKGRKHSDETLQRIRERTRLAMQNPKVKMKLVNFGHAQSEETRAKIGLGVRIGWERRRERLMVQETCLSEWQNLIAEASRIGYIGEEELLWDSYKILDEQLMTDWLESVVHRKTMPRPHGSKRAPKSVEQKRKISEAISAKWADPDYRERVCCGLAKHHGTRVGVVRNPREKLTGVAQSTRRSTQKKKDRDVGDAVVSDTVSPLEKLRLRRNDKPKYKDPLLTSKLEMIKGIRAQRVATESTKTEAVERARLLIAEAEKAARALEVAATKSPIAHASLLQTRELIAEAIQSIQSIGQDQLISNESSQHSFVGVTANELFNENGEDDAFRLTKQKTDNGWPSLLTKSNRLTFRAHVPLLRVNGNGVTQSSRNQSPAEFNLAGKELQSNSLKRYESMEQEKNINCNQLLSPIYDEEKGRVLNANGGKLLKPESISKKWVRGKLVEVNGFRWWVSSCHEAYDNSLRKPLLIREYIV